MPKEPMGDEFLALMRIAKELKKLSKPEAHRVLHYLADKLRTDMVDERVIQKIIETSDDNSDSLS